MSDFDKYNFKFLPHYPNLFFTTSPFENDIEYTQCQTLADKKLTNYDLTDELFQEDNYLNIYMPPFKPIDMDDKDYPAYAKAHWDKHRSAIATYLTDTKGIFNNLELSHRYLHIVEVDTRDDWQYVCYELSGAYVPTTQYNKGIMARKVIIKHSFDLSQEEDVLRLFKLGLFNFKSSHLSDLFAWSIKAKFFTIAKLLLPKVTNKTRCTTDITDYYFATNDELGLCRYLKTYQSIDNEVYLRYLMPKLVSFQWKDAISIIKSRYKALASSLHDSDPLEVIYPYFSLPEKIRILEAHKLSFLYEILRDKKSIYNNKHIVLAITRKQSDSSIKHSSSYRWVVGLILALYDLDEDKLMHYVLKRFKEVRDDFNVPLSNFARKVQSDNLIMYLKGIEAYTPSKGTKLNINKDQATQLHKTLIKACESGDTARVKQLSLYTSLLDKNSGEAIQVACKNDHLACVNLLLEAGANPNPWCSHTIKYANRNNNFDLKTLLMDYGLADKKFIW